MMPRSLLNCRNDYNCSAGGGDGVNTGLFRKKSSEHSFSAIKLVIRNWPSQQLCLFFLNFLSPRFLVRSFFSSTFSSDQEVMSLSSSTLTSLELGVGKIIPTSRVCFLTPFTISKFPEGKDHRCLWEQPWDLAGRQYIQISKWKFLSLQKCRLWPLLGGLECRREGGKVVRGGREGEKKGKREEERGEWREGGDKRRFFISESV